MPYIDGFVIAVPTANKQKFIDHANLGDSVFIEYGATRVLECWGDDVPDGTRTDHQGRMLAAYGSASSPAQAAGGPANASSAPAAT